MTNDTLIRVAQALEAIATALRDQPEFVHSDTGEPVAKTATPEPATEEPDVDLETVRGVLADLSRAGKTAQVRELITATGASKLSEVEPDRYAELLASARELEAA